MTGTYYTQIILGVTWYSLCGISDVKYSIFQANVSEMRTATTVFIGDISDRVSDTLVRQLLQVTTQCIRYRDVSVVVII